jgi:hypothetical protein
MPGILQVIFQTVHIDIEWTRYLLGLPWAIFPVGDSRCLGHTQY